MRSTLELADVVRKFRDPYLHQYPLGRVRHQARAMDAIERCRTRALGGHQESCGQCGHLRNVYNSCRNRHCPKCQTGARDRWLAKRQEDLLPVPYYHVVFTIPTHLAEIALQNKSVFYGILFKAAAKSMLKVGMNPKYLGARMGFLAVLHTWGQNLLHHPHLHCVVPAGGLDEFGRWKAPRHPDSFLLPVRVLSRLFRGIFLALLREAYLAGLLNFHGSLQGLTDFKAFCVCLHEAKKHEWVVYSKRPFGGPRQVLEYLGRYTHRVAISNNRLESQDGQQVAFRWKDYRTGQKDCLMSLTGVEFLRRFLLHVLPSGFVRIRHYGFLANCRRKLELAKCRLSFPALPSPAPRQTLFSEPEPGLGKFEQPCPTCQQCTWSVTEVFGPQRRQDSS